MTQKIDELAKGFEGIPERLKDLLQQADELFTLVTKEPENKDIAAKFLELEKRCGELEFQAVSFFDGLKQAIEIWKKIIKESSNLCSASIAFYQARKSFMESEEGQGQEVQGG